MESKQCQVCEKAAEFIMRKARGELGGWTQELGTFAEFEARKECNTCQDIYFFFKRMKENDRVKPTCRLRIQRGYAYPSFEIGTVSCLVIVH
jgi:hypothetical protein